MRVVPTERRTWHGWIRTNSRWSLSCRRDCIDCWQRTSTRHKNELTCRFEEIALMRPTDRGTVARHAARRRMRSFFSIFSDLQAFRTLLQSPNIGWFPGDREWNWGVNGWEKFQSTTCCWNIRLLASGVSVIIKECCSATIRVSYWKTFSWRYTSALKCSVENSFWQTRSRLVMMYNPIVLLSKLI